jgi:endonuclease YncB( thermonuclease family)
MPLTRSTPPEALDECTKANTPKWNFDGLKAVGKVISVYDGDTVTVAFNTFGLGFFAHNIRLTGIDAPEMRGNTAEEKAAAIKARDYLRSIVDGREVAMSVVTTDKYGRLLASLKVGDLDISAAMLSSGNAKPYSGGTREPYVERV